MLNQQIYLKNKYGRPNHTRCVKTPKLHLSIWINGEYYAIHRKCHVHWSPSWLVSSPSFTCSILLKARRFRDCSLIEFWFHWSNFSKSVTVTKLFGRYQNIQNLTACLILKKSRTSKCISWWAVPHNITPHTQLFLSNEIEIWLPVQTTHQHILFWMTQSVVRMKDIKEPVRITTPLSSPTINGTEAGPWDS